MPFRLAPLAALVAGTTMVSMAHPVYAADEKSVTDLQAEIARLKSALERSEQELASKTGAAAGPSTPVEPAARDKADEKQTLDAVVVRSRARIERLKDVPLSASVVTGAELERLGAADIDEITKRAGNVSWNQGNQRTSSLSIRGIGKVGQLEAQDPSVGVIADGVPLAFNPITSSYNFTDLDTLEVYRGPQGTLGGKQASVGIINVVTKKPSFTPSSDFYFSYGQRDKVAGRAVLGGPIVDGLLAWRGGLSLEQGKGDVVNTYAYDADRTYTNRNRVTGKVQFLLTPSDNFSARLSLEATPVAGEYTNSRSYNTPAARFFNDGTPTNATTGDDRVQRRWFTQNPGFYNYERDYLSQGDIKIDGGYPLQTGNNSVTGELNWKLGSYTLTSISGYRDYHFNAKNDDGTPFAISTTGGVHDTYHQLSQELRLSSPQGGLVDYTTGLFALNTHIDYTSYSNWLQDAGAWNATNAQYATLDANGAGRYLLFESVNGMFKKVRNDIKNRDLAVYGNLNWHLGEAVTLTTGLRFTKERRTNPSSNLLINEGNAPELNVHNKAGITQGFNSNGTTGALVAGNTTAQLNLADFVAQKYFGVAATSSPGAAYSSLTAAQRAQVAAAKTLRNSAIGTILQTTTPEPFNGVLPAFVVAPSYRINEDTTTYFAWQYGEKGGISQISGTTSRLTKSEKDSTYEWGVKTSLFDKKLILNANLYLANIRDYQQSTRELDVAASTPDNQVYVSYVGNVKKVRAKGLELDGILSPNPYTTIRFSGALNDARYVEHKTAALASEQNSNLLKVQDLSGRSLTGAPKYAFNIGADFSYPVLGDKVFHTSFNTVFTGRYNGDLALSEAAWIPAKAATDFGIGIGKIDNAFDVSLVAKNVFNDNTVLSQSRGGFTPAVPRWIGIQFTGKL